MNLAIQTNLKLHVRAISSAREIVRVNEPLASRDRLVIDKFRGYANYFLSRELSGKYSLRGKGYKTLLDCNLRLDKHSALFQLVE
jgi:hypothetical protein